jgi:hypothetical protein
MEPSASSQPTNSTGVATPAAAPAVVLPGVPTTWPGAFGIYKYSKQAVRLNLGTIVLLWLIDIAVNGGSEWILKSPGSLVGLIVGSLVTAALALTWLASIRGQRMEIGEALSKAMPFWLKMIGLTLLVVITVIASILLLVIPFFFVFPRLTLSYYYLVDKQMGVMDAYKASWDATKGNIGKVYGIVGATILMALLMITIIGIPFSIYFLLMYSASMAILYEFINKTKRAVAPAPPVPAQAPPASAQ